VVAGPNGNFNMIEVFGCFKGGIAKVDRKHQILVAIVLFFLLLPETLLPQANARPEIQAHFQQVERDFRAKRLDDAQRELAVILHLDPGNAIAYYDLGGIAYQGGHYEKAAQAFRSAFRLDHSLWKAEAFLGLCEARLGQTDAAGEHLAESFPHITEPQLRKQVVGNLIQTYYDQQNFSRILGVLSALHETDLKDPQVLYDAYRVYTQLASHALKSLIQVAPKSPRLREIVAETLMNQGDFNGAIDEYRKALKENPGLSGLHFELGQAILARSQTPAARAEAKKEFESELSVDPSNAYAEYGLGEIFWLDSNPKASLVHFSRAVKLSPGFVEAQIDLSKVLVSVGAVDKAITHLVAAASREPRNATIHYQLALAYRKLGRMRDADREMTSFQELRRRQVPTAPELSLFNGILGKRQPSPMDDTPGSGQQPSH
jgi:tetratricopeptide (TPR) repeat protein